MNRSNAYKMGARDEVPLLQWNLLSSTKPLTEGINGEIRTALLTLRDNQKIPVVLKLIGTPGSLDYTGSRVLEDEALVLHTLSGISGVPRLYGATRRYPYIVVMSMCPGVSVHHLWKRGKARDCLTAILHLCPVLADVHDRGVSHGDLRSGYNILFDFQRGSDSQVGLIDFSASVWNADEREKQNDVLELQGLVRDILEDMDKSFDPQIYERRTQVLTKLSEPLNFFQFSKVLRRMLYRPVG